MYVPAVKVKTITGVTYKSGTGPGGKMAVTIEANGVPTAETVTDFNNLGCNNHVSDNALYTGSVWWEATDGEGNYVDTTVTG